MSSTLSYIYYYSCGGQCCVHVSLTANVPVNNKQSSADEVTPAAEVQGDAKHGDDDTPDEELCSTMAVVGNINETLSQEFLEMLVENILRGLKASDSESLSQSYTLEIIPHISSAVVTFQSGKGTPL